MNARTLYIVWGLARPVSRRPYARRSDRLLRILHASPGRWLFPLSVAAPFLRPAPSWPLLPSFCSVPFFLLVRDLSPSPDFAAAPIFCPALARLPSILVPSALRLFVPCLLARSSAVPSSPARICCVSRLHGVAVAPGRLLVFRFPRSVCCLPPSWLAAAVFLLRCWSVASAPSGAVWLCFEPSPPLRLPCPATFPSLFSARRVPVFQRPLAAAAFLL